MISHENLEASREWCKQLRPTSSRLNFDQSLMEAYAGADIAHWWGNILRQLQDMKQRAEEMNNLEYSSLLQKFISQWEENELTGSVNIENVNALKIAADWASKLQWNFQNYFSVLTNWLRKLKASFEELPPGGMPPTEDKGGKGGGVNVSPEINVDKEPPVSQYGPEEVPGEMEQPAGEGDEEAVADDIQAAINSTTQP